MRKSLFMLVAATCALAAAAQQLCLSPELVNGLVFLGDPQLKVSVTRGQPAFMAGLKLPDSLVLIGNATRENGLHTVAYKTSLTTDKAYAAVTEALGADGWTPEASPGPATAFTVAGGSREATLCRDGDRRYIWVTDIAATRYVYVIMGLQSPRACNEDPAPRGGILLGSGAAPRFEFPAGPSLPLVLPGAGGGSNTVFTNGSRVIGAESPTRLASLLAGQLEAQGWQHAADWSAASGSAGSTWRRNFEGELIWGMLEIIRVSEETLDVDFTMAIR